LFPPERLQRRFAVAACIALGGLAATHLLEKPLAGADFVFSTAAVCISAFACGAVPALLALAISTAGALLFFPHDLEALGAVEKAMHYGVFVVVGAMLAIAGGHLRQAYAQAQRDRARYERLADRQRRARVRAMEQLEQLRMLDAITRNLAEGLCGVGNDGRILFVNAAACRLLGWREQELLDRPLHGVVRPRTVDGAPVPAHGWPLEPGDDRGVRQRQDLAFERRDGTTFPVAYSASKISHAGRDVGIALAFQDFSVHFHAERAEHFLAESSRVLTESLDWEATLARVAELAVPFLGDVCVVFVEEDGCPRGVTAASTDSARAQRIREEMDRVPVDLAAEHGVGRVVRTGAPELVPEVDAAAFAGEGASRARRLQVLRGLGLRSYLGVPLVARDRTLGAIAFGITEGTRRYGETDLVVAKDLAARCALALDNARLYREAQEATQSREEVLAVVSHDLRGPLAAVQLAAQFVQRVVRAEASPQLASACGVVGRATERLTRLVDDLVDFARLERGRVPLDRSPHDAEALVRDAVSVAAPLAAEAGVTLSTDVAAELAPISCDRHRILQVLANLVGNALKVTPRGGVVRVSTDAGCPKGTRFTVADSGPGIPSEDLPHVFQRYWRGKSATYEGSGLGLAIAKTVVDAHGGRIWVESAPGQGAAFHFTIPHEPA
jgi:PAS domain S-box-containing protein